MSLKFLVYFAILTIISESVLCDCGCNKLKRNDPSPPPAEENYDNVNPSAYSDDVVEPDEADSTFKRLVRESRENMSLIPGGPRSPIGTDQPIFAEDRESPVREINVDPFYLDQYEVSNGDFARFVEATEYRTDAEVFGDSFVFRDEISEAVQDEYVDFRVASATWWYKVKNVTWHQPEGLGSSVDDRLDHPAVHVSWKDARSYCRWVGKRLPSEAEWETACRGGKHDKLFPWGNKLQPYGEHWMNIWQGDFPDTNTADDGHRHACAVTKFRQNDFNLYNMVGNVWEWTSDYWDPAKQSATLSNAEYREVQRVKKGGSFLCHKSYCYRYRCAARAQNTADSSASNLGFRCAADV